MFISIFTQFITFSLRILLPFLSLLIWIAFPKYYPSDASAVFKCIAASQILALLIPLGSNHYLFSETQEKLQKLISFFILAFGLCLTFFIVFQASLSMQWWMFALPIAILNGYERIALGCYLKSKRLNWYYLLFFMGRVLSLFVLYFIHFSSGLIAILCVEVIARFPLLFGLTFSKIRYIDIFEVLNLERKKLKSSLALILANLATWGPISLAPLETSSESYLAARIIVFTFGLMSAFYLHDFVLESVKISKSPFIKNWFQVSLITVGMLITFWFGQVTKLYQSIGLGALSDLITRISLAISDAFIPIILSQGVFFISWGGALLISFYDENSELLAAFLSASVALVLLWMGLDLSWSIFGGGFIYYVSLPILLRQK